MHKVMLVDDEGYARQGLRTMIDWEDCGFEVCGEAEDGEEALRLIGELSPDLVITDIRMPEVSGLELIRSVREQGNDSVKFIIVSGYGDFAYAQQAIKFGVRDFILKPVDDGEVTGALRELAGQIEKESRDPGAAVPPVRAALDKLLRGDAPAEAGAEYARLLGVPQSAACGYLLVEAHCPALSAESAVEDVEAKDSLGAAISAAAASLGLKHDPSCVDRPRPGLYGLAVHLAPADAGTTLEGLAERLAARLGSRLGRPFTVYAGGQAESAAGLRVSRQEAMEAMQYRFAYPERRALCRSALRGEELRRMEFDPSEHAALNERLEDGDPLLRQEAVRRIFERFREQRFAPDAVHHAISRFAFGAIAAIRSLGGDEKELRSLEPLLAWRDRPLSPDGLRERFAAFVEESRELTSRLRSSGAKGDIARIKQYIDSRFHEEISLKSIAARFYLNPVYLGQLFKKSYGVYFNDYLLQLRIQQAKLLLRQTEKRVYEIARCVGFDNPDYFICKFEKVEGKSPTAYRNELKTG
ncbi:Two-component response regulator yesN [Paenibacillus pasadenensis]|uniref:Two-component response regulator yesN n=1 Tax=Paenibacillus pasadenensis TaxID=217090 RepID=A0A2N5N354_9BACL|nr:response regulator transcription factor [Paenibacillus pasadenensis]PLT44775.1 Two-component response regulator yesN [Paenibacillus pasadenensis]